MTKQLVLGFWLSLLALDVNAQWTSQDSLQLKQLLDGENELNLNREVVKQILLDKVMGTPDVWTEKSWMLPDESLPTVLPQKKGIVLTLHPYTANTRFDWDPVYQKKIKVTKDTWRGDPFYNMKAQRTYSNQAEDPMGGSIPIGRGSIALTGGTLSGLDLMLIFQKQFWDVKGNKRRARTLEVLQSYGDSTAVTLSEELIQPTIH